MKSYRANLPLGGVRGDVLARAGWRPAETDAPWALWLAVKGKGVEARLDALRPRSPEAQLGALPGGQWLGSKRRLWIALVRSLGPRAATVMPWTWLPEIEGDHRRLAGHLRDQPGTVLVLKDATRQRRAGVSIVEDPTTLDLGALAAAKPGTMLVQQAIPDLLEVAGRRFNLRTWVVVARADGRVRVSLHDDALLVYAQPTGSADERWITRPSETGPPPGAPGRLSALLPHLRDAGAPQGLVPRRIREAIVRCVEATLPELARAPHNDRPCFELFGVDLALDSALRAWVLEWNRRPRLRPRDEAERPFRERVYAGAMAAGGVAGFEPDPGFRQIADLPLPA
jgi:hypothetical protein